MWMESISLLFSDEMFLPPCIQLLVRRIYVSTAAVLECFGFLLRLLHYQFPNEFGVLSSNLAIKKGDKKVPITIFMLSVIIRKNHL